MPWQIQKAANYQRTASDLGDAEQRKVNEWTNYVTGMNVDPLSAATNLGYRIGPGPGALYEFYAGSYHRVFFTYSGDTQMLRLEQVGHVR